MVRVVWESSGSQLKWSGLIRWAFWYLKKRKKKGWIWDRVGQKKNGFRQWGSVGSWNIQFWPNTICFTLMCKFQVKESIYISFEKNNRTFSSRKLTLGYSHVKAYGDVLSKSVSFSPKKFILVKTTLKESSFSPKLRKICKLSRFWGIKILRNG